MIDPTEKKSEVAKVSTTLYSDSMGVNVIAMQEMLLQSHATVDKIGQYELGCGAMKILPSVPNTAAGKFKLHARGGFTVECKYHQNKEIDLLQVTSERGSELVMVNPFATCDITKNGQSFMTGVSDAEIRFATAQGDVYEFKDSTSAPT
jgi:hypothetical protein